MWSEDKAELKLGEGQDGGGYEAVLSSKGKEQGREIGNRRKRQKNVCSLLDRAGRRRLQVRESCKRKGNRLSLD